MYMLERVSGLRSAKAAIEPVREAFVESFTRPGACESRLSWRRLTTRCPPQGIVPMSYGRPGKPLAGYFVTDATGCAFGAASSARTQDAQSRLVCPLPPGSFP